MTATLVYLKPRSVTLFTDGMMVGPNGSMIAVKQKVQIAAHQSAAFVGRGPDRFGALLAVAVAQVQGSFDDILRAFPEQVVGAHRTMMAALQAGHSVSADPALIDGVLVGIDRSGRARGICVSSYEDDGQPPWTAKALAPAMPPSAAQLRFTPDDVQPALAFASPWPASMDFDLAVSGVKPWEPCLDVREHGRRIMRAQRSSGTVGGFCQMTTVTAGMVVTEIVERWQ